MAHIYTSLRDVTSRNRLHSSLLAGHQSTRFRNWDVVGAAIERVSFVSSGRIALIRRFRGWSRRLVARSCSPSTCDRRVVRDGLQRLRDEAGVTALPGAIVSATAERPLPTTHAPSFGGSGVSSSVRSSPDEDKEQVLRPMSLDNMTRG